VEIKNLSCINPKSKWLNLWNAAYEHNGHTGAWVFASRKDPPLAQSGEEKPDAVVICPIIRVENEYKVVAVREFRIPLNDYVYDLPAGLIEDGEKPETAARRELFQETGLELVSVLDQSPILYTSPGLADEAAVIMFVFARGELTNENQEGVEDIEVFSLGQSERLCGFGLPDATGSIKHFAGLPEGKMGTRLWFSFFFLPFIIPRLLSGIPKEDQLKPKLKKANMAHCHHSAQDWYSDNVTGMIGCLECDEEEERGQR
jgi:ADP-ribose pyrophosphatase